MQVQIKHISLSYFLVLILLKAMAAPLVVLHFQTHQPFIAKYLCVNRNNESSGCKGSCQLKKKLKTTTETPQQQSQNTNSISAGIDFFEHPEDLHLVIANGPVSVKFKNAVAHWPAGFTSAIFHPPSV